MDWGLIVLVKDRFKLGQMDFQIQVQTVLKEETNIRIIIVQMPVLKRKVTRLIFDLEDRVFDFSSSHTVDQHTCPGVVL